MRKTYPRVIKILDKSVDRELSPNEISCRLNC